MAGIVMFPKPRPSALERAERRKRQADEDALLRKQVRQRDKHRCVLCGRSVIPGAVLPEMRAEVHHIEARSQRPDRVRDITNMVTLCALDHERLRLHEIECEGVTAATFRRVR